MTAGKKIKGRKRHIGVDSDGRLLHVQAHRANQHDGSAGIEMFDALKEKYPTLELLCADSAYGGMARDYAAILLETTVQIVRKIGDGFQVAPKRWIVERTFAWLGHARRLSKDVEVTVRHSENMVRIAMLKLTLNQIFANP